MKFIGQTHITEELNIILQQLKETDDNLSFLLRAPSGYGKTILSFKMATYLVGNKYYYILPDSSGVVTAPLDRKVCIIDEVHTCKNQETLYPLIDAGKNTFIFTTNEAGELKEPLQNRCINYIFTDYTTGELNEIIDMNLIRKPNGFDYHPYFTNYTRTPRVINRICQRLGYIFSAYGVPTNEQVFRNIFENVLNIRDGLDAEQIKYIKFLLANQPVSLDLVSASIGVDKATIRRDIEPGLIYKGLIKITSRGRSLVTNA